MAQLQNRRLPLFRLRRSFPFPDSKQPFSHAQTMNAASAPSRIVALGTL
ncbi:MAG: hypothetical protein FWF31_02450 [Desulfobulbus sp.]|nr:hypothetical protein [Desulfobulbus sp.]